MTGISQGDVRRMVALACGFGCARAVTSNAYTTLFGTVLGSGHGFVAGTEFSIATNIVATLVAIAVVAFAVRAGRRDAEGADCREAMHHRPVLPLPVTGAACALLVLGYVAGTAGWFAALPHAAGVALCAGVYAAGMVALTTSWFELFASESDVHGAVRALVGGYLVQAGAYAGLGALSGWALCAVAVAALAATFALMAGLRVGQDAETGRTGAAGQTTTTDGIGTTGAPVATFPNASALPARSLRELLGDLSGSLLCVFVLTAVVGFLHTSVLGSAFEQVIGAVSMSVALVAAAVLLAGIVFVSHRVPQTTSVYRVVFPVMLTVLSILPFAAEALGHVAGTAMVVCNDLVGMAFVLLLLEVARGCSAPPVALMGIYQAGSHLALVLGLALGLALGAVHAGEDASYATLLILACIYPLAMVLTYLSRRRSRDAESKLIEDAGGAAPGSRRAAGGEGASQQGQQCQEAQAGQMSQAAAFSQERAAQQVVRERVAERVTAYALEKGLTPREAQVAVQLARGRTAGAIASDLGISENTAWAHIKHAYVKLGVHGKQELIELIEREVIARGESENRQA